MLKDFTSYVILNCDGLEAPTILSQKEVSDYTGCVLFELSELSEEELALRKRIEEVYEVTEVATPAEVVGGYKASS